MSRNLILTLLAAGTVTMGGAGVAQAAPAPAAPQVDAFTVQTFAPDYDPRGDYCQGVHPPYSTCGFALVDLTLSGYDRFGGIEPCTGEVSACKVYGVVGGYAFGSPGSARFTASYRCGTEARVRHVTAPVRVGVVYGGVASTVLGYTSLNSNSAKVTAGIEFPTPQSFSACLGQTNLIKAKLDKIVVTVYGQSGVPDVTYRDNRHYAIPVA